MKADLHPSAAEYVILLHGLARSSCSMAALDRALNKAGYQTINVNYPSTKYPIESLAISYISKALAKCPKTRKVHFVTHSMGGILLRYYLKQHSINSLGRTVMLGPPNQGSEIVDKLGSMPGFKLINGPAGQQLGTSRNSAPNNLGPVNFELGVIAGTRHFNPILASFIPSPHDDKVSVESSKIKGMQAHISLAVTHSFMMNNDNVINYVTHFLKQGTF